MGIAPEADMPSPSCRAVSPVDTRMARERGRGQKSTGAQATGVISKVGG